MNLVVPFHVVPSAAWLEAALRGLCRFFRFVSLADLDDYFAGRRRFTNACHLTFDDGHSSFYDIAYPMLRRRGIPATLFVSPRVIEQHTAYWFQELAAYRASAGEAAIRAVLTESIGKPAEQLASVSINSILLCLPIDEIHRVLDAVRVRHGLAAPTNVNISVEELREITASGLVTAGAHTNDHPVLANETDARARDEIAGSVARLSELLGRPVISFAYPNGTEGLDFAMREHAMLREAGVRLAVSTDPAFFTARTNPLAIPRGGCPSLEGESELKIAARLALLPVWAPISQWMSPHRRSERQERALIGQILRS